MKTTTERKELKKKMEKALKNLGGWKHLVLLRYAEINKITGDTYIEKKGMEMMEEKKAKAIRAMKDYFYAEYVAKLEAEKV